MSTPINFQTFISSFTKNIQSKKEAPAEIKKPVRVNRENPGLKEVLNKALSENKVVPEKKKEPEVKKIEVPVKQAISLNELKNGKFFNSTAQAWSVERR